MAALWRLAAALDAHPQDRDALTIYGHLRAHLADALEDHLTPDRDGGDD